MFGIGQKVVLKNDCCDKAGRPSLHDKGEVVGHGVVRDRDGVRTVYLVELEYGITSMDEEAFVSTLVCDPSVVFEDK